MNSTNKDEEMGDEGIFRRMQSISFNMAGVGCTVGQETGKNLSKDLLALHFQF